MIMATSLRVPDLSYITEATIWNTVLIIQNNYLPYAIIQWIQMHEELIGMCLLQ